MRYDLRVLWVEDAPEWCEKQKEMLEMKISDLGLSSLINCTDDGRQLLTQLDKENIGFKKYDLVFIDYSLPDEIVGSMIIKTLREKNIDSDILFYSSEMEREIRDAVSKDVGSFEGVYIANRDNFLEKSLYLVRKNARRMTSILNIRGVLMDQTSENDFVVKSYLLKMFDKLDSNQREEISKYVLEYINSKQIQASNQVEAEAIKIKVNGITNIRNVLKLPSHVLTQELKYTIFKMIITYMEDESFSENSIEDYLTSVVKARNTLAHKKLDLCESQKYIKYSDDINQLNARKCDKNCENHVDDNKISVDEWESIRADVLTYGQCFDNVLTRIIGEI